MILQRRSKTFSGYSESAPSGTSYMSGQVITDYILDPIDKSIEVLESTPIAKSEGIKRKTGRIRGIVRPLKKLLEKRKNKKK